MSLSTQQLDAMMHEYFGVAVWRRFQRLLGDAGWKLVRAHNLHDVPLDAVPGGEPAQDIADPGT